MTHPGGDYLPPWWRETPSISSSAVHLYRLQGAYYMPHFGVVVSEDGEIMRSSLAQVQYRLTALSDLPYVVGDDSAPILLRPPQLETLDRAVVTMPWGAIHNYGHFVLDCLPGVASLLQTNMLESFDFVFPPLKPWQHRHLELLGVTQRTELDHLVYYVSDLVFPSCLGGFLHSPNINYRTVRDLQLVKTRSDWVSPSTKVYVSRGKSLKRQLVSETRLERLLAKEGFAIVDPTGLSIDDQIALFSSVELVVGCTGAALANTLYCKQGTTVVEILPSPMVQSPQASGIWLNNICALLRLRWHPYFTSRIVGDPERVGERGFSFDLDLADFLDHVNQAAAHL